MSVPLRTRIEMIEHNLSYHELKPGQSERITQIYQEAKKLAYLIVSLTPASTEQSIAMSELDSALSWAEKAIRRNE